MTYLFSQYWIFIGLAFTLGLFVGWSTCGAGEDRGGGWLGWAIVGFIAGLFLAVFKVVPGLAGHMLEVALLLLGAYLVGCAVGCGGQWGGNGGDSEKAPAETSVAQDAFTHEEIFGKDTSASYPGKRPDFLAAPRGGHADDLCAIAGVDAGTAKALGDIGVHHYDQIAAWGAPQKQWVEHHLAQAGRIDREDWIGQAKRLSAGVGEARGAHSAAPASERSQEKPAAQDAADQPDAAEDAAVADAPASDETAELAARIETVDPTQSRLI